MPVPGQGWRARARTRARAPGQRLVGVPGWLDGSCFLASVVWLPRRTCQIAGNVAALLALRAGAVTGAWLPAVLLMAFCGHAGVVLTPLSEPSLRSR